MHPNSGLSTEISKDATQVWSGLAIALTANLIVRRRYEAFTDSKHFVY